MLRMIVDLLCIGFAAAVLYYYFWRREKHQIERIQGMLDAAKEGNFQNEIIDESTESALEDSFRRFLTDQELLSSNLEEQKSRIQALVADISHQTVTPIANILLYSQILEESVTDKKLHREAEAIRKQAQKLSFLTESLVKTSRLETGIIAVNPENGSIEELILDVISSLSAKASEKHQEITCGSIKGTAWFDEKWTREALINLVDNAIKYTPEYGHISLQVTEYQMFTRIDVIDDGIGISQEHITDIFQRFYREGRAKDYEGVGLGLYLARQIISEEGGYIKVKSVLDSGSTFSVFLQKEENVSTL